MVNLKRDDNELTLKVNCSYKQICEKLESLGFKLIDEYTLNDDYYTIKETNIVDMLKDYLLVREVANKLFLTHKIKDISPDGSILCQQIDKVEILNKTDAEKFLIGLSYSKFLNIKTELKVFTNNDIEIAVQFANDEIVLIEVELEQKRLNKSFKNLEELKNYIFALDLDIDKSNLFVEKTELVYNYQNKSSYDGSVIKIYTDGACSGNPGKGGWGAILFYKDIKKELCGSSELTTNNIMELTAALEALKSLKQPCKVELYSDSAYLINGFTQGWVENWQRNGFKNAKKQPVENKEIWEQLISLNNYHNITWIKVKGHSDNIYNNRCDELARMGYEN